MKRNNNHARGDAVDGFVRGIAHVANDVVAHTVAHFYFGGEDEVGVIKFEAETEVVSVIDGFYFYYIVEPARTGIGIEIVIELATRAHIKTKIILAVRFEFEFDGQTEQYRFEIIFFQTVVVQRKVEGFFANHKRGYGAHINKIAELQIAHYTQLKTLPPNGFDIFYRIKLGKVFRLIQAVLRRVETECNTKIIRLFVVFRIVHAVVLRQSGAG